MLREIIGQPPSEEALREDFRLFLEHLKSVGISDVETQFGFAWGNFRYPGEWQYETLNISALLAEVAATEKKGDGTLG
ncbi:MAG: hypothetical protein DME57_10365, partial [Verrucomicrobia bacterium]